MKKLILALVFFIVTHPAFADVQTLPYAIYINEIPMGNAQLEIIKNNDQTYQISISLDTLFPGLPAGSELQTQGKLINQFPKPEKYSITFTWDNIKETRVFTFDWQHQQIINTKNKKYPLPENALDGLSVVLALQQDLSKKNSMLNYTVTDGKRLYPLQFNNLKTEEIKTNNKIFKTELIQSQEVDNLPTISAWFEEDTQIPVQATIVLKNELTIRATLNSL